MTNKSLLEELQQALKVAGEKESLAEKELVEAIDKKGAMKSINEFTYFNTAQGFTNGILEAIEIIRINERNEQ